MTTMSKIANKIGKKHKHIGIRKIRLALYMILDEIGEKLAGRERVEIQNFGVFYTVTRKSFKLYVHTTGETIIVPKKLLPMFRPVASMKKRMNIDEIE